MDRPADSHYWCSCQQRYHGRASGNCNAFLQRHHVLAWDQQFYWTRMMVFAFKTAF